MALSQNTQKQDKNLELINKNPSILSPFKISRGIKLLPAI